MHQDLTAIRRVGEGNRGTFMHAPSFWKWNSQMPQNTQLTRTQAACRQITNCLFTGPIHQHQAGEHTQHTQQCGYKKGRFQVFYLLSFQTQFPIQIVINCAWILRSDLFKKRFKFQTTVLEWFWQYRGRPGLVHFSWVFKETSFLHSKKSLKISPASHSVQNSPSCFHMVSPLHNI